MITTIRQYMAALQLLRTWRRVETAERLEVYHLIKKIKSI